MNARSEDGRAGLILQAVVSLLIFMAVLVGIVRSGDESTGELDIEGQGADAVVLTNAAQLSDLFLKGYSYPLGVWAWQPVMFDPVLTVWTDTKSLPKELAPLEDHLSELVYGVPAWPLWMILYPQSAEIVIQKPWSDEELTRLPVPKGFPAWEVYETVLRDSCLLSGINSTNWQELVKQGYSYFAPPRVVVQAHLAEVKDAPTYFANMAAEAKAFEEELVKLQGGPTVVPQFGFSSVMPGGGGGTMLLMGGGCAITNETQPFVVVAIEQETNAWVTITWESCLGYLYQADTSEQLSTQTVWTVRATLIGEDGTTSWTDTNAPAFTQRFYRVRRLPSEGDFDSDFWMNGAELAAGTDPTNAASHSAFSLAINGGADVVSSAQWAVGLVTGVVAQSVLISEDITFATVVMNTFAQSFAYTLLNTNDGLHTVYLRLLNGDGTTSTIFGRTVRLDTAGPALTITSPTNGTVTAQRRLTVSGSAADVNDAYTQADASKPLDVTVNDAFVNDRDTDGVWSSGPHDLVEGTNTFTVVAADRAGFSATNTVFAIYDPTLATNVPVFTVDVTNSVVLGSNTTSLALSGTIDDDNATVQIAVVDAVDHTIIHASVRAAVHGTNWWTEIPALPGSNLVVITAHNAGSVSVSNSFAVTQNANVFLEITSPAANTAANATNVLVVGRASTNFNQSITINGQAALTSTGTGVITFSNTVAFGSIDANVIDVQAAGTGGNAVAVRRLVYGYEFLGLHQDEAYPSGHVEHDCWFAHHYPDQHKYEGTFVGVWDWSAPQSNYNGYLYAVDYAYSGTILGEDIFPYDSEFYPDSLDIDDSGWSHGDYYKDYQRVNGSGYLTELGYILDCPSYYTNCVFQNPPYGEGESASCCIDNIEHTEEDVLNRHTVTFIKHWPTDEEQTVILHFDGFYYFPNDEGVLAERARFWGQPGFWYSTNSSSIGFLVKIKTNTRYTIRDTDFTVPMFNYDGEFLNPPNAQSWGHYHEAGQMLGYNTFANASAKYHEKSPFSGFTEDKKPQAYWLVVPLGGTNVCQTWIGGTTGDGPYSFASVNPAIAHPLTNQAPSKAGLQIVPLPIFGDQVGDTQIELRDTAHTNAQHTNGILLATLNVRVLPRKEVTVQFIRPLATNSVVSTRTAQSATNALNHLNKVWNKQANIYFVGHETLLWSEPDMGTNVTWGAIMNGTATQGTSDAARVHAWLSQQDPPYILPSTLPFIFAHEVETAADDGATNDLEDAFYDRFLHAVFVDDQTCSEQWIHPHEAGHHLSDSNHFQHSNYQTGDWQREDNLMQPRCEPPEDQRHITHRQAKDANDNLPPP